jgi:hypothetical protein
MAAINFPPRTQGVPDLTLVTLGDLSTEYYWTGEQWLSVGLGGGGGASVTIQSTPPSSPSAGDLWFDNDSGILSMYYDSTWVDVGGGDSGTSAGSVNGIVKADGAGNFSAALSGTDYLALANFTGANQDLVGTSGYQIFPGGLIVQWIDAFTSNGVGVINFPMAFPNFFLMAVVSEGSSAGWNNQFTVYGETGSNNAQLQIVGYSVQNGGNILTAGLINFNCIAIGI